MGDTGDRGLVGIGAQAAEGAHKKIALAEFDKLIGGKVHIVDPQRPALYIDRQKIGNTNGPSP
jgi:hypothetical protein